MFQSLGSKGVRAIVLVLESSNFVCKLNLGANFDFWSNLPHSYPQGTSWGRGYFYPSPQKNVIPWGAPWGLGVGEVTSKIKINTQMEFVY